MERQIIITLQLNADVATSKYTAVQFLSQLSFLPVAADPCRPRHAVCYLAARAAAVSLLCMLP